MSNLLEEELSKKLAEAIAEEIDFEILGSILLEQGWIRVSIGSQLYEPEISLWLVHNCKDQHHKLSSTIWFKDSRDANWFKMRWYEYS